MGMVGGIDEGGSADENVAEVDLGENAVVRRVVGVVTAGNVGSTALHAKADSRVTAAAVVLFVRENAESHNLAIITPSVKAASVAVPLQRSVGQ